jgi:hypothetical protein
MMYSTEISLVVRYLLESGFEKIMIENQEVRARRLNANGVDEQKVHLVVGGKFVTVLGNYRDEDARVPTENIEEYIKEQL